MINFVTIVSFAINIILFLIYLYQLHNQSKERSRMEAEIAAWQRNTEAIVAATGKMTLNIEQKNAIELKSGLMTLACFANSMNVAMDDEIKKKQGILSKLYAYIKKFYLSLF
jgi:hypothetical protein